MRPAPFTHRPIALTLGLLALGVGALSAGRVPPGTKTLATPSELKWGPMPGLPGAQQSPMWGDPQTGEHGILYRWPAGTAAPQHTHTSSEHGVVISGTLTLAVDGAAAKALPAGSYFSMYGGTKHATVCLAGADCVFFIHREGPFDANMVATSSAGILDGKTFVGQIGETGKSKGDDDSFVFAQSQFRSTACASYGFQPVAYVAEPQGGSLGFAATAQSRAEGTMEWKGTVSGSTVSGTAVWKKPGKAPVEYWFRGTAK